MLSVSSRCGSQNLIVVINDVFLSERTTKIGVENVVTGSGIDGATGARTNDDVHIVDCFFCQRGIFSFAGRFLLEAKEPKE